MVIDWVAFCLAITYLLLLFALLKQVFDIFWLRNRKINYRNGIVSIMAAASFLRVIFWAKTAVPTHGPITFFMICFYLPIWLNFAALSLLSLFYANTIYKNQYGNWPWRICVILNILFLALNLTIACLIREVTTHHGNIYTLYVSYAIFLDGFTALLVGYFGYKFVALHNQPGAQYLLPRSIEEFSAVNWILVLCFLARSVFVGVLSSGHIVHPRSVKVDFNGPHKHTSATLFLFFLFTEIVPNLCMLYLLWRSTSSMPRLHHGKGDDGYYSNLSFHYDRDVFDAVRKSSVEDSIITVFYGKDDEDDEDDGEGEDLFATPLLTTVSSNS